MGRAGKQRVVKPRSEKIAIFRVLAAVLLPFMYLLGRYRIENGEKLPATGPVVVAPNHYSEIDPVVMGVAIWNRGRAPRYLAKASLFSVPVVGWFLRRSGQIPVQRAGTRGSDPLGAANQLVDQGLAVVVYPEGSLTRDPNLWPMRGKTGAVRLALTAGVPLIPVAHWGSQEIMPRYGKKISFFPRKDVRIRFGDPVDLSPFVGLPINTTMLNAATEILMDAIADLLGELRGEKPPHPRWDPTKQGQAETGRFEERS